MLRGLRYALVAAACVLSTVLSRSAAAQLAGIATRAADFSPVDETALGATRQSSAGLSAISGELVGAGAMSVWRGALHAYFGAGSLQWSTGLAYSQTSIARTVASGLHFTLGEQLSSGYRHLDRYGYNGAVNLRVPVGLTLGNPDGVSLAAYAAPYGELGVKRFFGLTQCPTFDNCTRGPMEYRGSNAAGLGMGVRASAGRVAIGLLISDVAFRQRFSFSNSSSAMLGVSVQLGN